MAELKNIILVVDDDESSRSLLHEILKYAGYDVLEAADGQEALELLEKTPVDLLITDRAMPHLGGLELLKKLRDRNNAIPVLMISGYGEESLWGRAIGLGALDYLLKPFKTEEVLKIVRKSLPGVKKS